MSHLITKGSEMAEYNGYTQEFVCTKFAVYVNKNFKTQTAAAKHYGVKDSYLTRIIKFEKPPKSDMLADIGFEVRNGFVRARK
jgi:hypothetical protein